LLIDFDNVTMGMRSDLSKELKTLLASDVIKGKVSVQRAYADWRRYPQYIVPLSEASVDLIFAPAYGSNKKNATDIRMAIDALELVFVRPEIGTFILLTGDSDFSSLVLKLKEYGKYVIGVGIQESSSDILVQNCDEYYSYTSLTGLTKTTELSSRNRDPWMLVKEAVEKMVQRGDVMRSDRLKQVMQELDPNFDERSIGFSKFSKFLAEAGSRGLVELTKVGNGQYEVAPASESGRVPRAEAESTARPRRSGRGGRRERREGAAPLSEPTQVEAAAAGAPAPRQGPLEEAYRLLRTALERLRAAGRDPARDSDVKRKILDERPDFDEAELGFAKFSRFLAQAEEHGVVRTSRGAGGGLEVSLATGVSGMPPVGSRADEQGERGQGDESPPPFGLDGEPDRKPEPALRAAATPAPLPPAEAAAPVVIEVRPTEPVSGLGPRRGSTRRRGTDETALSPGAHAGTLSEGSVTAGDGGTASEDGAVVAVVAAGPGTPLEGLGLPTEPEAIVRYLTHRYKGVGDKTAQALVERFGTSLFATLRDHPDAVAEVIPPGRAEQLIEAWRADFERRVAIRNGGSASGRFDRTGGQRVRGRDRSRGHRGD
jgi:uncharacterized protein (TIGR00288 family)